MITDTPSAPLAPPLTTKMRVKWPTLNALRQARTDQLIPPQYATDAAMLDYVIRQWLEANGVPQAEQSAKTKKAAKK